MPEHRIYDKYGRTYLLEIKYWYIGVPKDLPLDELPAEEEDARFVVDAYHAGNVCSFIHFRWIAHLTFLPFTPVVHTIHGTSMR